ncbi:hypothetical protein V6N11_026160 [Hibiscus sabdariffa]|uniref:Secreted protein n=1 Tax=Hibiscus sabdariffa TaxID=183260 RepID=A0ABR2SVI6_9ROSI
MLFQIATLVVLIPYAPPSSPLSSAASVTVPASQDRQSRAPASLYISIGPASRGRLPNVTMKRLTPFAAAVAPVPFFSIVEVSYALHMRAIGTKLAFNKQHSHFKSAKSIHAHVLKNGSY